MEDSICRSHLFPKEEQEFEGRHLSLDDTRSLARISLTVNDSWLPVSRYGNDLFMNCSNVPNFNSQGQYKAVQKKPRIQLQTHQFYEMRKEKKPMIYFTSDVHDKLESNGLTCYANSKV